MTTTAAPPPKVAKPGGVQGPVGESDASQSPLKRVGKRILGYSVLVFFALLYLLPFVLTILTSFKTDPDATNNPIGLIPDPVTMDAWNYVLGREGGSQQNNLPLWLRNSIFVSACITAGRVFLDSLAGYALARMNFPGRKAIFLFIIATLAVPGVVLMIPRFLVLKQLHLINTFAGLILPLAMDAVGIFIMKQFFESIPREMEEAARIDGAGVWRTYWNIILPLARPGLITLTILSFQGSWNEFTHVLVAAPNAPEKWTLPVGLSQIQGPLGSGNAFPKLMAASLITTIPVAIIFFVFQRYFVRGQAAGGVKG